jgi:hypothetical protein
MASKLIRLEDGILIEVEVPDNQIQQIAGGGIDHVNTAISAVCQLVKRKSK